MSIPKGLQEKPCRDCGERTGGLLYLHAGDCYYVAQMGAKYPAISTFLQDNKWRGRKSLRYQVARVKKYFSGLYWDIKRTLNTFVKRLNA